jgi:hypothetical protein
MESKKGIQCTYTKCFRKGQQGSCPAGGQAEGPAPGQLPAQVGVHQVGGTRLHLQFSSYSEACWAASSAGGSTASRSNKTPSSVLQLLSSNCWAASSSGGRTASRSNKTPSGESWKKQIICCKDLIFQVYACLTLSSMAQVICDLAFLNDNSSKIS